MWCRHVTWTAWHSMSEPFLGFPSCIFNKYILISWILPSDIPYFIDAKAWSTVNQTQEGSLVSFANSLWHNSRAGDSNLLAPLSCGNNPINSLNGMEMMGLITCWCRRKACITRHDLVAFRLLSRHIMRPKLFCRRVCVSACARV